MFNASPVEINGITFPHRRDARNYIKGVLEDYAVGDAITGDDQEFFYSLFRQQLKLRIARQKEWVTALRVKESKGAPGITIAAECNDRPDIVCSWRRALHDLPTA